MTTNETNLFIVSTPLHLFIALGLASGPYKNNKNTLLFIDQASANSPYVNCIRQWQTMPMVFIDALETAPKNPLKKIQHRKNNFSKLISHCESIKPARVFTGNDRRIEFQFCMHICTEVLNLDTRGIYMDEGAFSYFGRKASNSWQDKIIDSNLKKLSYGSWWKHPPTVGASEWIDKVYAFFPEYLYQGLKNKQTQALKPEWYHSEIMLEFCKTILKFFNFNIPSLSSKDILLTLPHESIILGTPGYQQFIEQLVITHQEQGYRVLIKHHPRNIRENLLNLNDESIFIDPRPFLESIIPLLNKATIIGDLSSTLLTAKWLSPKSQVEAVQLPGTKYPENLLSLFQNLDISVTAVN